MEKRRRARINESLGQLKTLILDALKKDVSTHLSPRLLIDLQNPLCQTSRKRVRNPNDVFLSFPSELQALKTGEGGHPGDDCEASPEPSEGSNDR